MSRAPLASPVASLAERLRPVVARALGDDMTTIAELRRLTGGANSETWAFRAVPVGGGDGRELILRLPMGETGGARFATEAGALRGAARAGVPEPEVLAHGDDPAEMGAPYLIMEFVHGETLARRILRDEAYAAVRPRLAAQCGEILARIHRVAPDEVPGVEEPEPLQTLRSILDAFEEPQPALELGYRWLVEHRPEHGSPTLVHGDFRNGNLVVDATGIRAVLDWEMVHTGDPMEDLGYLCSRVWRFGGPGPVGGFGEREALFEAYERAGGRRVDPLAVRWWELWSTVRWGTGCLQMGARHLSGVRRSVELAAVGRRVWEQEYDVMLFLDELERS